MLGGSSHLLALIAKEGPVSAFLARYSHLLAIWRRAAPAAGPDPGGDIGLAGSWRTQIDRFP
jgi:hypothetical protein